MGFSSNALYLVPFLLATCVSAGEGRFRDWYPRYADGFNEIVDNNCAVQYENFRNGTTYYDASKSWDPDPGAYAVINCILEATPELIKVNLASCQVLLGLMPTILAIIASNIQETAMVFVLRRRPLLALCLAVGSPAVYFDRSFKYREQIEGLQRKKETSIFIRPGGGLAVALIQYLVAFVSIANIAQLSYDIGTKASFTFAQDTAELPYIWAFIGAVIHLLGALALWLRTTVTTLSDNKPDSAPPPNLFDHLKTQFIPSREVESIHVDVRPPNLPYYLLSWATSILSVCHIIFGTLLFSGILFVGVSDGVNIVLRYMGSMVICRAVVLYELVILRATTKRVTDDGRELYVSGSRVQTVAEAETYAELSVHANKGLKMDRRVVGAA
ncbi:hypothetical protein FQN54_000587 [Arachnomyces sp. PD_36]|nr:hypothetical protein FQN54_000587 [Arachnomyces sp. PD_36]